MKNCLFILLALFLSNCHKFPASPCDDEDLRHKPEIVRIEPADAVDYNLALYLDYSYSEKSNIILERKTKGGFERINFVRSSQTALMDTSFNKELDNNFIYRVSVEKSGCRSDYSSEKSFDYISKMLYAPVELHTTTLELQGIRLEWRDRSGKEDGYKVEKNDGSGWVELASLPANTQNYLHAISGIPSLPLQLSYRVRAYNNALASKWAEAATMYSGIGVPTNLRIADTTFYRFTIEWRDNSNIESGYIVERNKNGSAFSEIAQLSPNTIQYIDKITEIGSYGYRVRAKKDNLYSLYSNNVSHNVKSVLPTEGLVASYLFKGNANDESGNGNNCTIHGATLTQDRFGNPNSALRFNGVSDYLEANASKLPVAERTICVWFFANSVSNQPSILGYGGNGNWGTTWFMGLNVNARQSFHMSSHNLINSIDYHYPEPPIGKWYNWTMTTDANGTKIYVNGVLKQSNANFVRDTYVTGRKIGIGIITGPDGAAPYADGNVSYFGGILDDIRIYNRSLTATEIDVLYHEGGWGN